MPLSKDWRKKVIIDPQAQARMEALAGIENISDPLPSAMLFGAGNLSRAGNIAVMLARQLGDTQQVVDAAKTGGMSKKKAAKLLASTTFLTPLLSMLTRRYITPPIQTEVPGIQQNLASRLSSRFF